MMAFFQNIGWWEYLLFAYLIGIGIRSFKFHPVSLRNLLILPILFTAYTFYMVVRNQVTPAEMVLWLFAICVGCIGGWLIIKRLNLRIDKEKRVIFLEKTLVTFGLALSFIIISIAFRHINMDKRVTILFLGLFTGVFIGRGLCFLTKYLQKRTGS